MDWVVSRCGMNIDSVMDEGCIRMRGLPYGCTKEEVASFFSGMKSNFSVRITFYRMQMDGKLHDSRSFASFFFLLNAIRILLTNGLFVYF